MTIKTKICGLKTPEAVQAAVKGRADYLGFVFYPTSPRNIEPEQARRIAIGLSPSIKKVAVTVNPTDKDIRVILSEFKVDYIQLHGNESPYRIKEIKGVFGLPIIKAVNIHDADDVEKAREYEAVAEMLLFDTKAPDNNYMPGGTFDWTMLKDMELTKPWFLAGGINNENVAEALALSGANMLDVSSGLEYKPGEKSTALIAEFLRTIAQLNEE